MTLFRQGFGHYLENRELSDLILVVSDVEHHVHRIIISHSSEYFMKLLSGDFVESQFERIVLKFPDPKNVFPQVLRYMYTGSVLLTVENVIPLLSTADHYLVHSLKKLTQDYLSMNLTRENALSILQKALEFNVPEIVETCLSVVAKNFCNIQGNYNFLPFSEFYRLLEHKYLSIKNEYELYLTVAEYVRIHSERLESENVEKLMECVRFRWLTFDQLKEAEQNNAVPRRLLLEALMIRLKTYEKGVGDVVEEEAKCKRLAPRITAGLRFEYRKDFDENGILFWISTNACREPWVNPDMGGKIKVTASSIEKGVPCELVSRSPTELWTKDVPASWFMIDMGRNRRVIPNYYTLRHGGNYKADSLRTWDLQGSVDGGQWTLLRRHTSDKSLNGNFATRSWPVDPPSTPFRFFRILQTGHNSNNHNFLVISGFEIYGELYES